MDNNKRLRLAMIAELISFVVIMVLFIVFRTHAVETMPKWLFKTLYYITFAGVGVLLIAGTFVIVQLIRIARRNRRK